MKNAVIFLADGFEEIEAIAPIDVLRRANVNITIATISKNKDVFGGQKVFIKCDDFLENLQPENFDLIILPGGLVGTKNLYACEMLGIFLQKANDLQKKIAAICAAPIVLDKFKILKNRNYTCYPSCEEKITTGIFTGKDTEICENIITSRGVGTALDFALVLLNLLNLTEVAINLKSTMLIK